VGGGITWDSLSAAEYEEARVKAQLLVERRPEFSLVETLRWEPEAGYVLWEQHLGRLADSAEYFGFAYDRDEVETALTELVDRAGETLRVRLVLRRDGEVEVTGVALPVGMSTEFDPSAEPIRFAIDAEPVSTQNVFLFHKTTHRAVYDDRLKRHTHADDVLLHNERGEATEFTIGNLAIKVDGTWWTPPIGSGLLGGVFRNALVAQGVLQEREIHLDEVEGAQQVAFVNSVRGWRPAELFRGGDVIAGEFPGTSSVS
jgi:para-aminobenzoate synthetase/4-amino-4-deoxychorismate lyase